MKKLTKNIIIIYVVLFPLLLFSKNNTIVDENKFTVVLDAGHGGKDPGAIGSKSKEKDIALAITLKAGKYIEENMPDVNVIYTRTTDVYPELIERAEIANKNKAQLFISIHVNFNPSSKPYGTSSYVLGLHRADENFEVAKRENSVILLEEDYETKYQNFDPNKPESYIIFSVMQNTYLNQSVEIAALIQNQFKVRAKRKDMGVKQQGLLVLAQISMPGVLIETGFISNRNEEAYLMSKEGQDYLASAIYRAFKEYKQIIDSKSVVSLKNESIENFNVPEKIENKDSNVVEITDLSPSTVNHTNENALKTPDETKSFDVQDSTIYYRIQVSSSYARLDTKSKFFKGHTDIDFYETDGIYKYVTGKETSYDKIKMLLDDVKKTFPDAFIIAVKNNEIISLQQAFSKTGLKNNNIN